MERQRRKGIAIGVITIVLCCIALLVCISVFNPNIEKNTEHDINVLPTAAETLNPTYGAFYNGSTYIYTDYTKVEDMHNGTRSDDTTSVTVDSNQPHGSQKNPYVIDSIARWNAFVSDMNTTTSGIMNYGAGTYFVLACDLDFSGVTNFIAVNRFDGNFYGCGHTIKNVSNGSVLFTGVFKQTYPTTVIADINMEGHNITVLGYGVGTLVGQAMGGKLLNCHMDGQVNYYTAPTSINPKFSGFIGCTTADSATEIFIYRCSVNLQTESNASNAQYEICVGSFIGQLSKYTAITMLDCVGNSIITATAKNNAGVGSGIIGCYYLSPANLRIENYVGDVKVNNINNFTINNTSSYMNYLGSLFGYFVLNNTNGGIPNLKLNNVYVNGNATSGATEYTLYPVTMDSPTNSLIKTTTINNCNYAGNGSMVSTSTGVLTSNKITNSFIKASSIASLWSSAKTNFSGNNIWKNANEIGNTYSIENSPVRNTIFNGAEISVKYRNKKTSGDEPLVGADEATYGYAGGDTLPIPDAPDGNHIFVGWTCSDTGEVAFTSMPINMYGDITLYAVWDMPDSARSASISARGGVNSVEYDYGTVVLEGEVTSTVLTDPKVEYSWRKSGDTAVLGREKTYILRNVSDSGTYVLGYTIRDSVEPLWRHSDETNPFSASVTPGKLKLRDGSFALTSVAYVGMLLEEITFEAVVVDVKNGQPISGTVTWNREVQQIKQEDLTEANEDGGKFATKVKFEPDAAYNGNYDGSATYDVELDAEYIKINYIMRQVGDTISCKVNYNENIPSARIVGMFYSEFNRRVEAGEEGYSDVKDRAPHFDDVLISEYDEDISHIKASKDITVRFDVKEFSVTFDADNGDEPIVVGGYYYNNVILSKDVPKGLSNGGMVFRGWWNLDYVNESGIVEPKKWDFLNDKVTSNLTLTGRWLDVTLLDLTNLEVKAVDSVTALDPVGELTLQVTATYEGNVDGEDLKETVELDWGVYKVIYASGRENDVMHVNTPEVTIRYTHRGVTLEKTVTITVEKKEVDVSYMKFESAEYEYDGSVKSIVVIGSRPPQVADIEYIYKKGGEIVDSSEVIEPGIYTVTAKFIMSDPDYKAELADAILTIFPQAEAVTIEWDTNKLVYNGKVQHPQATVKDANGNVINVDVTYEFETEEAITVGRGYKVKAVIDRLTGYRIEGDASITFDIEKAILDTPTLKGAIYYNGSEIKLEDNLNGYISEIMSIEDGVGTNAGDYYAQIVLNDLNNCEWKDGGLSVTVKWTINKASLTARWDAWEYLLHSGVTYSPKVNGFTGLKDNDAEKIDFVNDLIYLGTSEATVAGAYEVSVAFSGNGAWSSNYELNGNTKLFWVITPRAGMQIITVEWTIPEGGLVYDGKIQHPTYKVYDMNGNDITETVKLELGGDYATSKWAGKYTVTASVAQDSNYFIRSGSSYEYEIAAQADGTGEKPDEDESGNGFKLPENMPWWQLIASVISIILLIAFFTKGIGYASKRKQNKKTIESRYKTYYAAGLFGLTMTNWTIIASVLMGLAVLSFIFMLLEKRGYNKSVRELEDARIEYERNEKDIEKRRRDEEKEEMKMMFMHMMGGNAGGMNGGGQQGGFVYAGQGLGVEDIRGIVSETVTALLPGMQQLLPQQASANDELVQKLIDQNEKLMKKLTEQSESKEIAATTSNEKEIESILDRLTERMITSDKTVEKIVEVDKRDDRIDALIKANEDLMKNQETLMRQMDELKANQQVEKIVEVPVEKVVEKVVEVPVEKIVEIPVEVEKIVEKEVPVEVEKIVEKEVVKEVKVEVPVEVEKIVEVPVEVEKVVEKIVEIPSAKPAPKAKTVAPRLTLDEAYEKLSAKQKKIFDTLKAYAMSKDKCKEKKSTYYILLGQSSVNPLVKLTIKKDTTVALFKMEDEFMKDIRRNATNDGTKVKVKETELIVGDMQALATAKEMVDLREDQIERYNEYLREQRSMKK